MPSTMPTPAPSPTSIPDTAAASKPARRTVRTYGKKRPLSDTNKGNVLTTPSTTSRYVKRQKTTETDSDEENRATTAPSDASKDLVDGMPGRLLEEAVGAERSSTQQHKTPTTSATQKVIAHPQKAGSSSRNQGIKRYFQSATPRCSSATPSPQLLPTSSPSDPTCYPASSSLSVPSLSPCPAKHRFGPSEDDSALTSPLRTTSERRQRQKRRLVIRPGLSISTPIADDETTAEPIRGMVGEESVEKANDGKNKDCPLMTARSSTLSRPKMLKMETTRIPAAKKRKKATSTVPVQTTLSLAIAGGTSASVKECKECNILYNPLHDKDAKFHARYHASACRRLQELARVAGSGSHTKS